MICFIALIIFGILGIFSATHRKLALEAFDCVFRKITLRKCHTGLDIRLKSGITGKLLLKSPKTGKFVYHHFEFISGVFTILLIGSLIWSGISGYNYYVYGNCNGASVEDQQGLCIFDPSGDNAQISSCDNEDLQLQTEGAEPNIEEIELSLFPSYKPNLKKDTLVYVGCYTCINTRKVNPTINELMVRNKETLEFTFIHLPLSKDQEYLSKIENCLFIKDKLKFWEFHNSLMQMPIDDVKDSQKVLSLLAEIKDLDNTEIIKCSESKASEDLFKKQLTEISKMNVEGTPTIFVNQQAFIGPKPLRVYERQLSTNTDWFGIGLVSLGAVIVLIMLYFAIFRREK
ncbi:hypothetical protein COY27_05775 [Candidatus Woesearchaeota archaeon CG_4_10_14_0_2_um_filter_33_13]|nr:MAG: hypothetical protein COY27_05775 [Candidatus Woesearchaeota archaeon CG_4_10_14_0_2_um_filter_33_13]